MKKIINFIFILSCSVILLCFTQCTKDPTYKVKITCRHTNTGIDTSSVISGAAVVIGQENATEGPVDSYAKAVGLTDNNGIFEWNFKYEALLNVTATYYDTVDATNYIGAGQIKLVADEVVEKTVLLIKQ